MLLPGKCHGQRSLVGYSPWGHKESDTTEQLSWTELIAWFQTLKNRLRRKTIWNPHLLWSFWGKKWQSYHFCIPEINSTWPLQDYESGFPYRDVDGPRDCHTEWSRSEREKQISCINTYMWNIGKWCTLILFTKQKLRHRHREQTYGHRGEKRGELGAWDWHIRTAVCETAD